jgi:hypothetical protein
MAQAQRYQFEQRSNGRGAVVRIGLSGGKKVINVYTDQDAAEAVVDLLNRLKYREA